MNRRRTRFMYNGKQSFPTPVGAGFPLHSLVASYTRSLIPVSPLHYELLDLVFTYIGLPEAKSILKQSIAPNLPNSEMELLSKTADEDDLLKWMHPYLEKSEGKTRMQTLRDLLQESLINKCPSFPPENSPYRKRRRKLATVLGLSDVEIRLLEFCVCFETSVDLERYCDQYNALDWLPIMAVALNLSYQEVRAYVLQDAALVQKGLIEITSHSIKVQESVLRYLLGMEADFLDKDTYTVLDSSHYPLSSFPLKAQQLKVLQIALNLPQPRNLLLHGRPGTGKTELAKALILEANQQPFLVHFKEENRKMALTATLALAPEDAVLIIDEADTLLNDSGFYNPGRMDKGWVNQFMDNATRKIIWISNDIEGVPTSILRRFSYSVEFTRFTVAQRRVAWEAQVRNHKMSRQIPSAMITRMTQRYEINADGIASAVSMMNQVAKEKTIGEQDFEETLGQLLSHHQKLTGVSCCAGKLLPLTTHYDPGALHTDVPLDLIVNNLRHRNTERMPPTILLLWGPPGTGKTEFSKHLAEQLDKPLFCKRSSDLQSKWLGDTEKQIAAAFEEARAESAVLLLDEADSLLIERESATRSWECSQTNELLTQLENFNGICICCTNRLQGLDSAALRRFTWKVEFKPLTEKGRVRLFRKYFQPRGALSKSVQQGLRDSTRLVPGDYRTVALQYQGAAQQPTSTEIIQALKREIQYKPKCNADIGFIR